MSVNSHGHFPALRLQMLARADFRRGIGVIRFGCLLTLSIIGVWREPKNRDKLPISYAFAPMPETCEMGAQAPRPAAAADAGIGMVEVKQRKQERNGATSLALRPLAAGSREPEARTAGPRSGQPQPPFPEFPAAYVGRDHQPPLLERTSRAPTRTGMRTTPMERTASVRATGSVHVKRMSRGDSAREAAARRPPAHAPHPSPPRTGGAHHPDTPWCAHGSRASPAA